MRRMMPLPDNLPLLLTGGYLVLEGIAIVAAVEALLGDRPPQSAIAWSLFLVMFPLLGLPFYLLFGGRRFSGYVNARRSGNEPLQRLAREIGSRLPAAALARFSVEEDRHRALARLAHMPFFAGNDSRLLIDGEATFAAIFRAIDAATDYVMLQFYLVRDDGLGVELQRRMMQKAREGRRVYFLYDAVGSNTLADDYVDSLREAGVRTSAFRGSSRRGGHPFRVNFRNHRKIVVVDGHTAFVGGHNVGDEYLGKSRDPALRPWRDTHVMIEGPAVLGVQMAFMEDWHWMTQEIPPVRTRPVFAATANQRILVLPSGPADDLATCGLLFTGLIHSARRRIWIVSPYFVPDDPLISALQLATLRGVDVRIMLPEQPEHLLIYLARFSYLEETLPLGIRFFCYQAGFLHQKVVLVDDELAGIGTANLDNRSFRLNFEITLLFVDRQCVADVGAMLVRDFAACRQLTLEEIARRPFWFRLATRIARLFSPVL